MAFVNVRSGIATHFLVLVLIAALSHIGCVPSRQKSRTLEAIETFHQRFNHSQFSEIYDETDERTKQTVSKADFVEGMTAMRQGQGAVLQSEEINSDYNYP